MVYAYHPRGGYIRGIIVGTLRDDDYGMRVVIMGTADHAPSLLMEFTVWAGDVLGKVRKGS